MFKKISIAFDNAGCPNRCKHCWLGIHPNKSVPIETMRDISNRFSKFTNILTVDTWVREPDYPDNYKELWEFSKEVSINTSPQRFELCSFYRLNRDPNYIDWLKTFDITTYQLTVFGGKELTDYYVGRKGAFEEIINATNILLDNGLIPRWQMFANKETIKEITLVQNLIKELNLEERCKELGHSFKFFIHVGSVDGENSKHYDKWITSSDLQTIPQEHFQGAETLLTESEIIKKYSNSTKKNNIIEDEPIFFISSNLDVFPNYTEMSPWWSLGNLNNLSLDEILTNYKKNKSVAQHTMINTPYNYLVKHYGNPNSDRLFYEEDYLTYLLNRHCEKLTK